MKNSLRTLTLPVLLILGGIQPTLSNSPDDEEFLEEFLRGDDLLALEIPELDDIFRPLPLWKIDTTLNTGIGYRDNVLFGSFDPKGGSFLLGGFETAFLRLPGDGPRFSLLLEAEHLEFFSNRDLPGDTFAGAFSQLGIPLPRDFTLNVRFVAFYLDQMTDVATILSPIEPIRVRGFGFTPSVALRKKWETAFFVEASVSASRQEFRASISDFWEYGPKIAAGFSPGNNEVSLNLEYLERSYDDRIGIAADGTQVPDSDVAFRIVRPWVEASHTWGEAWRWRSRSRFGMEFVRDDEFGHFAYDRVRLSQQLGFRHRRWDLQGRAGYSLFNYKVQEVPGSGELRQRHSWALGLEARRRLLEYLELFARYDLEKVRSNEPETDYEVNTWTLGLGWKF